MGKSEANVTASISNLELDLTLETRQRLAQAVAKHNLTPEAHRDIILAWTGRTAGHGI